MADTFSVLNEGKIVDFNLADLCGYIQPANGGNEIYFHIDDLRDLGLFTDVTDAQFAQKVRANETLMVEKLPIIFNSIENEWEITTNAPPATPQPIIRGNEEQPDFGLLYEAYTDPAPMPTRNTPRGDQQQPVAAWPDAASDVGEQRQATQPEVKTKTTSAEVIERVTGEVKFYNDSKGFGFIMRHDGKKDVFVHATDSKAIGINLVEGMIVTFDVIQGKKGLQAIHLVLGEGDTAPAQTAPAAVAPDPTVPAPTVPAPVAPTTPLKTRRATLSMPGKKPNAKTDPT
jgi:cold shock protein